MRIAILIPVHGETKAAFTKSLARMLIYTLNSTISVNGEPTNPAIEVFTKSTSILPFSRQLLLQDAIDWKADYLLWMDSDHTFPPDTLLRLLGSEKPVIGANYLTRHRPTQPTAGRIIDRHRHPVPTTREVADTTPVEQVDNVGLGLCLMSMAAIDALRKRQGGSVLQPTFATRMLIIDGALDVQGEDGFFFLELAAAGVPVFVDHLLSLEVGHIAECVLGFTE